MECNISREARAAINDLIARLYPGPATPDEVWDKLCMISRFYPEIATFAAIPWLVEQFEPLFAWVGGTDETREVDIIEQ